MTKILFIERNPEEQQRAIHYISTLKKIQLTVPDYSHRTFFSRDAMAELMDQVQKDVREADYVVSDFLFQPGVNQNLQNLFDVVGPLMQGHKKFVTSELSKHGFNVFQGKNRRAVEKVSQEQGRIRNTISAVLEPLSSQSFVFHPEEVATRVCAEAVLQGRPIFSTNIALSGTVNNELFNFLEQRLGVQYRDGFFEYVPEKEDISSSIEIPKAFELQKYPKNWNKICKSLI